MTNATDKQITGELAKEIAEIAALPVQQTRLREWKALNALKPERPMFTIDQICWGQLNYADELTLRCTDSFARKLEDSLRKMLYRWNHLRDDRVVEPVIGVSMVIRGGIYNRRVSETLLKNHESDGVMSHHFKDQLSTDEDIENLEMLDIEYDSTATDENISRTEELLGGHLEVKAVGQSLSLAIWDRISEFRGVDKVLYDIIDRPDFIKKTVDKFAAMSTKLVDQLEEQGLLEPAQSLIHCAGGWTDDLPKQGFNPEKPRASDCWIMGMAQMFATVSPAMHDEYEIQPLKPLLERFGLVNYGCCEPLDQKIDIIKVKAAFNSTIFKISADRSYITAEKFKLKLLPGI